MDQDNQNILDNISTGIITLDAELRVTAINASAQALLETSASRGTGQHASKLVMHSAEWLGTLLQVLSSNTSFTSRTVTLALPSGQDILVDVIITPLADADGGLVVELQAGVRQRKISREENQLRTQEATRAVIRGLAHEIKNPLGGVRGAAQLLARELPDEELSEYTRVIIHEADRLRDLVDRLLGPNRELELAPHNIHEVLEHVRDLIAAESDNRARLRRDYDPSLPEFNYDKAQLIQAVLNIMRNALQAAPDLDHCEITLRSRSQRQFTIGNQRHRLVCRVDIIDNGPGIPRNMLHTVFAPMVTGRADGTGLGLSIAQSIITRHGGALECDSQPGATRFTFYLPMDNDNAQAS